MAAHFELITELQTLTRRDFPVADPTILQPTGAAPLIDGEWLELDANYKLARDAAVTSFTQANGQSVNPLVFPVHTERGRYDTQAIGKVNVLFLGMYEAETDVCDSGLALGAQLAVDTVNVFGLATRRGLTTKTEATAVLVGHVSKVISTTRIRFIHFGNQVTQ